MPKLELLIMRNAMIHYILPAYERVKDSAVKFEKLADRLCQTPSKTSLSSARTGFTELAESWAGIELIRFGAVTEENRFERFLFYPDRKSTGLKQVQRILANRDVSAIDGRRLAGKSVAVQGLGALEYLLFGKNSESLTKGNEFRCAYTQAIAVNLRGMSAEIREDWQAKDRTGQLWTEPGARNPILTSPREAVNELLGTLVHGLETIRDIRIGAFLKSDAERDKPRRALFRRSKNTLLIIGANIRAVRELLVQSELRGLMSPEDVPLVDNVIFELQNLELAVGSINEPVAEALENSKERKKLAYLLTSLNYAIRLFDEDIAQAAGLSSGFSFSDGD